MFLFSGLGHGGSNSRHDMGISATAAEIAGHGFADLIVGLGMAFMDQTHRGTDLTGRAVAALKSIVFDKGSLHRMQLLPLRQALNGCNVLFAMHDGERKAGVNPFSVYQHCASTALAVVAAFLGARQSNIFA